MIDRFDTFLFDLDGTLTDPREGIIRCYQYAMAQLGFEEPSQERVMQLIGPPLRWGFGQLMQTDDALLIERAVAAYRERFGTVGLFENLLHPGAIDLLRYLHNGKKNVFLVTSKAEPYAIRICDHFGFSPFLNGVYGASLDGRLDNKADLIALALETNGLDPHKSMMIGDRVQDANAACAHGVPAIGVRCGYALPGELEEVGCLAIFDDLHALHRALS